MFEQLLYTFNCLRGFVSNENIQKRGFSLNPGQGVPFLQNLCRVWFTFNSNFSPLVSSALEIIPCNLTFKLSFFVPFSHSLDL